MKNMYLTVGSQGYKLEVSSVQSAAKVREMIRPENLLDNGLSLDLFDGRRILIYPSKADTISLVWDHEDD